MQIGPFVLRSPVWLAPMAGVTDLPFRELCWRFGVGLTISEMLASKEALRENPRTRLRAHFGANTGPRVVQLLGTDPMQFAEAARYHVDRGAEWIDLNMGCPAKKVCQVAAGSALLRDEDRVARIFDAVTRAVNVPVTVKIRTGWDPQQRNAVRIAQLAERSGLSAITVHGRTRTCGFHGAAEYDTIRHVKQAVRIPVIANGDIDSATKARAVLRHTGADALMIGRAAQGSGPVRRDPTHRTGADLVQKFSAKICVERKIPPIPMPMNGGPPSRTIMFSRSRNCCVVTGPGAPGESTSAGSPPTVPTPVTRWIGSPPAQGSSADATPM